MTPQTVILDIDKTVSRFDDFFIELDKVRPDGPTKVVCITGLGDSSEINIRLAPIVAKYGLFYAAIIDSRQYSQEEIEMIGHFDNEEIVDHFKERMYKNLNPVLVFRDDYTSQVEIGSQNAPQRAVFFSNYHISVNNPLVDDLTTCECTIYMPDSDWGGRIKFFAPNDEHRGKKNVRLISFEEFLKLDPMAIIIPCIQMIDDFYKLMSDRNDIDQVVFLTANSNATDPGNFPLDGTDYVISHDLIFHRKTKAKYKMLYFNRPTLTINKTKDIEASFTSKQINLFINNFVHDKAGFDLEFPVTNEFKKLWEKHSGTYLPFYGYGNPDGWPKPFQTQTLMVDSMFTLISKRRETWGQAVNESMLLGTPCIFFRQFLFSTFTQYEITEDNSILVDSPKEALDKIKNMGLAEYETLCMEAKTTAERFCVDEPRRQQLHWLIDKIYFTSPKLNHGSTL